MGLLDFWYRNDPHSKAVQSDDPQQAAHYFQRAGHRVENFVRASHVSVSSYSPNFHSRPAPRANVNVNLNIVGSVVFLALLMAAATGVLGFVLLMAVVLLGSAIALSNDQRNTYRP